MKKISAFFFFSALVFLAGCGSKLSGTYSEGTGISKVRMTFSSGGTVIQEAMGSQLEWKYELDGKNIKLFSPVAGTAVMTLQDNDTIDFKGTKLKKE